MHNIGKIMDGYNAGGKAWGWYKIGSVQNIKAACKQLNWQGQAHAMPELCQTAGREWNSNSADVGILRP